MDPLDCVVIGGGPAGLTAAVYLARFRRRFVVLDGGDSRAAWIPRSHNLPGFPDGIGGRELLQRLHDQACRYGATIRPATATALAREADGFAIGVDGDTLHARTVLLATGCVDRTPEIADLRGAVASGVVRYCGICDAFEVTGKRLGVLGPDDHGVREALFLRHYAEDVTLVAPSADTMPDEAGRTVLAAAGIVCADAPLAHAEVVGERIAVRTMSGERLVFDHLYAALGSAVRSGIVNGVGAELTGAGCVVTDTHQRTDVDGLFAAGDVVTGVDQIAVAMGQAAIAATAIHNRLRAA